MNNKEIKEIMDQQYNNTVELINANRTSVNAGIEALNDTVDLKFNIMDKNLSKVLKKQDETNGRVRILEAFRLTFKFKMIGAIAIAVILSVVIHKFGLLELLNIIK